MFNFALFNDDIIGVRGTWPSLHYVRLGIVNPVGTDGRPPTRMGWSENRERESLGIVNPVGTDGRPPTRMSWSENRERERESLGIVNPVVGLGKLCQHIFEQNG